VPDNYTWIVNKLMAKRALFDPIYWVVIEHQEGSSNRDYNEP
jgi:hypothetical protein